MNITIIAGARPNFMKIAPIIHAIQQAESAGHSIHFRLVHTGQHYDRNMSQAFFDELDIPAPAVNFGVGGGSQAEQAAAIMVAFENDLLLHPANLVLVVGDVTSTMACAIVAKKMNTKVAHVEAGLRSYDLSMPEEVNRMVTDSITDYFFTTSEFANRNLRKEGVALDKIFFVGNVMIDTLLANKSRFKVPRILTELNSESGEYFVMTMHRPANVDEMEKLKTFIQEITCSVRGFPVIFPIHPRTARVLGEAGVNFPNLHVVEPLGYLEFNYLVQHARAVITDSGGITEEATVMGVPCMTLRDNTERPETVKIGTNVIVGTNPMAIRPAFEKLFSGGWKKGDTPQLWDGQAAKRIVDHLLQILTHG